MHVRLPLGLAVLSLLIATPLALATTVIQPTFDSLVGSSDYIVRATVKSVVSEWRTNPAKPTQAYIGSKVTLDVKEVIKGTPPSPLVLDMVGGRVGEDELFIDGAPRFVAGEESILFIQGNGVNYTPLNALMHGFFPVRHDIASGRDQVLRYNGLPLFSEKELEPAVKPASVARSGAALTPQAFSARIQQHQREISSREKQN